MIICNVEKELKFRFKNSLFANDTTKNKFEFLYPHVIINLFYGEIKERKVYLNKNNKNLKLSLTIPIFKFTFHFPKFFNNQTKSGDED